MKRVMIVGGPGSGKSTVAALLGEGTGIAVFHMDHIHWKPGWVERDVEEKDRMCHEVHLLEDWIFEGGHSRTYEERIHRADTFVWLDIPVGLRLFRIIRRLISNYGKTRSDMPENCPENFRWRTIEFITFIWRTRHSSRAKHQAIAENPPAHLTVFHLRNSQEVRQFLETQCKGQSHIDGTRKNGGN